MHIRVHLVPQSFLPPTMPATAVVEDGLDGEGVADLFCDESMPDTVRDACVQTIRMLRARKRPFPH